MNNKMNVEERNNKAELIQNILRWFSYGMALLFIVIGAGILSGLLFPGFFPINTNKRLVLGGIILLYGAVRMITLCRKRKKEKISEEIIDKD